MAGLTEMYGNCFRHGRARVSSNITPDQACGHGARDGYDYLYFKINQPATSSSWSSSSYDDPVCVKTCPTDSSYTSVDCASSAGVDCSVAHSYITSKRKSELKSSLRPLLYP